MVIEESGTLVEERNRTAAGRRTLSHSRLTQLVLLASAVRSR